VNVLYKTKLESDEDTADGKTKVILQNGELMFPDVCIPALGFSPLTSYVPSHLLNDKGAVETEESTFRVNDAGPRVRALGDVTSFTRGGILEIMSEAPVLVANLRRGLVAAHEDVNAKPSGSDRIYKPDHRETQLVPIGRSKGVGAVFGWTMPSFAVWVIKGRDYMMPRGVRRIYGKDEEKEPR
jgi:hypothetical protein